MGWFKKIFVNPSPTHRLMEQVAPKPSAKIQKWGQENLPAIGGTVGGAVGTYFGGPIGGAVLGKAGAELGKAAQKDDGTVVDPNAPDYTNLGIGLGSAAGGIANNQWGSGSGSNSSGSNTTTGGGTGAGGGAPPAGGGGGGTDWGSWLASGGDLILAGLAANQGNKQQNQSNQWNQQALALALARDAALGDMRTKGGQTLMNAKRPDLSQDFRSSNPFARPLRRV